MLKEPTHLTCEYFVNPLGIDAPRPRLSWRVNDTRRGAMQTGYQVVVAASDEALVSRRHTLWDSGRVVSGQSVLVEYLGPPLTSRQRCWWQVRTWDHRDVASPWSEPAWWEMGLLSRGDWKGRWIGSTLVGGPRTGAPSPYLRRKFRVEKPVQSARLYVTALGLYECRLNGRRVGDDVFTPGRTEYSRRVQYQTYDVTGMLTGGDNVLGAILGDGWYAGHNHSDPRMGYGDRPRLLAQLMIDHADGTTSILATDGTWRWSTGPIRSADLLMGEDYDARMEIPGWDTADFDDSRWASAEVFPDPGIAIAASASPRVRRIQEIRPIAAPTSPKPRRWIFDLGQNMVGRVRLKAAGPAGTTLTIRHAEMLDASGQLYVESLRSARATDYYTKKTDGQETYEPTFTFHGFRYVEVRGLHGPATQDTVTGIVLHSDTPPTGHFECSDPLVNQLQSNIVWSQKGNFLEIPTDCPQRDERLGWTGDAQVFARTAAFNMNVAGFFTKWMVDMNDAQRPDGAIPSTVPFCPSIANEGGPAWADAAVIVPWTMYLCYGDRRILADNYAMMGRFMDYLARTTHNFIRADETVKWRGYGDWLSINAHTPQDLIGTAFYAYSARLMSKIAAVLGKADDSARYGKLFEDVRGAWQKRFLAADGQLTVQTQTAHVLALHFDLLPAELRPAAVAALVRDIESRHMHLSTGFVGTPYLNLVLTEGGRTDVAYALLLQKTCPSWLFPVTHGATTIWERWDGWTPEKGFADAGMNSFNHYAYGAVGAWLYAVVGGIDLDESRPGYRRIIIRPRPGGGLTHATASLESPYGPIRSAWRLDAGMFHLDVAIPPNTTAAVHLPTADPQRILLDGQSLPQPAAIDGGLAVVELGSGDYALAAPFQSL